MPRSTDFIIEARADAQKLWAAWESLMEKQREWNALDYGNTLPDTTINNQTITRAQVGAVVFDTANAIKGIMDAGNATNVARLL